MTTSPERAHPDRPTDVLSVRSPSAMLASIPYLIGFAPTNSLVVLLMAAPRGRVVMTVRVDLPPDDVEVAAVMLVNDLVPRLTHAGADSAVAVVYSDDKGGAGSGSSGDYPGTHLVHELGRELDLVGIDMVDALFVSDGRRWSYLCESQTCCPIDGVPVDDGESHSVRASLVWQGLAPATTRDEVVARVEADPVAQRRVADAMAGIDATTCAGWSPRDVYTVLDEVLAEEMHAGRPGESEATVSTPSAVDATGRDARLGQLLRALELIPVRDLVLRHVVLTASRQESARTLADALCALVRRAPESFVAPIATITALVSWLAGDGLIGIEAVTRALTDDSEYRLAQLAYVALDSGLPPRCLLEMCEQLSDEECLTGRTAVFSDQEPAGESLGSDGCG